MTGYVQATEQEITLALAELAGANVRHGPLPLERIIGAQIPRDITFTPRQLMDFREMVIRGAMVGEGIAQLPEIL